MSKDQEGWKANTIGALLMSLLCFLPTGMAAIVILGLLAFQALAAGLTYLYIEPDAQGAMMFIAGLLTSVVALTSGPLIAGLGLVLHPIGFGFAVYAYRDGAKATAVVSMSLHTLTFLVAGVVAVTGVRMIAGV